MKNCENQNRPLTTAQTNQIVGHFNRFLWFWPGTQKRNTVLRWNYCECVGLMSHGEIAMFFFVSTHCKVHVCTPWNRINRFSFIFKWKKKKKKKNWNKNEFVMSFDFHGITHIFLLYSEQLRQSERNKKACYFVYTMWWSVSNFYNNFPISSKYVSIHSIQ